MKYQPNADRHRFTILFAIVFAMSLLCSASAHADRGGWVASGGELFRFGKNPWFLKNVTAVDYCIQVDTVSVSASTATVHDVVKEAISYWQNEFKAQAAAVAPGFAAVGTQTFNEVAKCDPSTPLQFKIGYGALSPDEIEFLVEPQKFVGVSVRKEYDNETMTVSGIVFIVSDIGPNAYSARPNSSHLYAQAWKERKLLMYALVHELGHVFGIPHTGSGLMSEVFLEQLLHKRFVQFYLDNPVSSFLLPPMTMESCALFGTFNAGFFQVPLDAACVRLEGKTIGVNYQWAVSYRKAMKDPLTPAGNIDATPLLQLLVHAKPASVIQLPTEQKVFSLQNRQMNTFVIGPVFTETTARGVFTSPASHRPSDLQIELRTDSVVMTGLVGGRMIPVFVYSPQSLLTQMFPVAP
ncbi:hypothetical protein BH10BDE1_BH10BDE1_36240 [soil metagenome]